MAVRLTLCSMVPRVLNSIEPLVRPLGPDGRFCRTNAHSRACHTKITDPIQLSGASCLRGVAVRASTLRGIPQNVKGGPWGIPDLIPPPTTIAEKTSLVLHPLDRRDATVVRAFFKQNYHTTVFFQTP